MRLGAGPRKGWECACALAAGRKTGAPARSKTPWPHQNSQDAVEAEPKQPEGPLGRQGRGRSESQPMVVCGKSDVCSWSSSSGRRKVC